MAEDRGAIDRYVQPVAKYWLWWWWLIESLLTWMFLGQMFLWYDARLPSSYYTIRILISSPDERQVLRIDLVSKGHNFNETQSQMGTYSALHLQILMSDTNSSSGCSWCRRPTFPCWCFPSSSYRTKRCLCTCGRLPPFPTSGTPSTLPSRQCTASDVPRCPATKPCASSENHRPTFITWASPPRLRPTFAP